MTSGTTLIMLSCGKLSPARFAAMAAGGVTSPVMRVESSNLLRLTLVFMKSMNSFFFSDASFAPSHFLKMSCSFKKKMKIDILFYLFIYLFLCVFSPILYLWYGEKLCYMNLVGWWNIVVFTRQCCIDCAVAFKRNWNDEFLLINK